MKYRIDEKGPDTRVFFSGTLVIAHAAEIREVLLGIAAKADRVAIDLSEVTEIDIPALQLFCSLHRSFVRSGKAVTLESGMPQGVKDAIRIAGFERDKGCRLDLPGTCLWKRMEDL